MPAQTRHRSYLLANNNNNSSSPPKSSTTTTTATKSRQTGTKSKAGGRAKPAKTARIVITSSGETGGESSEDSVDDEHLSGVSNRLKNISCGRSIKSLLKAQNKNVVVQPLVQSTECCDDLAPLPVQVSPVANKTNTTGLNAVTTNLTTKKFKGRRRGTAGTGRPAKKVAGRSAKLNSSLVANGSPSSKENHQITEYFPVVSRRLLAVKSKQENDFKLIVDHVESGQDPVHNLDVVDFGDKGKGIVAKNAIRKGEFICEYIGDLISLDKAQVSCWVIAFLRSLNDSLFVPDSRR